MKIFISYADQDKAVAEKLASQLSQVGYDVWYSAGRILPGDNWALAVGKALEDSDAMIVLLTLAAVESSAVRREIDFALGSLKYRDRLIPVQVGSLSPDRIPWILRKLKIIRLAKDRENVVDCIIERLEIAPV